MFEIIVIAVVCAIIFVVTLIYFINGVTEIDGVEYKHYGFMNKEYYDPSIEYKISWKTIIGSLLFLKTVFVPLYFLLFNLYTPVRKKG